MDKVSCYYKAMYHEILKLKFNGSDSMTLQLRCVWILKFERLNNIKIDMHMEIKIHV